MGMVFNNETGNIYDDNILMGKVFKKWNVENIKVPCSTYIFTKGNTEIRYRIRYAQKVKGSSLTFNWKHNISGNAMHMP